MTKSIVLLLLLGISMGQRAAGQARPSAPPPRITPTSPQLEERDQPVTPDDVAILVRAQALLSSSAVWNRADDRECTDDEASGRRSLPLRKQQLSHYRISS